MARPTAQRPREPGQGLDGSPAVRPSGWGRSGLSSANRGFRARSIGSKWLEVNGR